MGEDAVAGGAHDPERDQPAALRHAQGHHGGEEEGDPKGRSSGSHAASPEDLELVRSREGQEDAVDFRLAGRSSARTGAQAARRSPGDRVILVVAEQRGGKLNRASWETIAAAQQLAASGPVSVAVPGSNLQAVAAE